jgi:hypothetical protein
MKIGPQPSRQTHPFSHPAKISAAELSTLEQIRTSEPNDRPQQG